MPQISRARPRSAAPLLAAAACLAATLAACATSAGPASSPAPAEAAVPVRAAMPAPPTVPAGMIPPREDARIHEIVGATSPERIERDVRTLVGFGTRHTLSDTLSSTRGIGAARRWIFAEFERISAECGGCLEVFYQADTLAAGTSQRIPDEVVVVNVVAVQRGATDPNRFVLMSGDIDSRVSDALDATSESPGANDNASGVAGTLEAARVLTRYRFDGSIVYAALSGEEQGLFGGQGMAAWAKARGWEIEGVVNNDMIGNFRGITGVEDNTTARVFAPGISPTATEQELRRFLYAGGELDVPSRQLGRYVVRTADVYVPNLDVLLIYRLDRFGRGGHHTPFFNEGFPAVRLMETNENYDRQHQDLRVEDGIRYGDVIEGVDFDYAAKMTSLNAAVLSSLAWAPAPPENVRIAGAVQPSTRLSWDAVDAPDLAGYRVYWRRPTEATWTKSRWVGNVTEVTLENIIIDNYFFGVAAVDREGHESLVVYPVPGR